LGIAFLLMCLGIVLYDQWILEMVADALGDLDKQGDLYYIAQIWWVEFTNDKNTSDFAVHA